MCDTIPTIKHKHNFRMATIYQSYDFLEKIAETIFDDVLVNCSRETPVTWPEYRKIQLKAFMDYITKIFTKEFLELHSVSFYYMLIEHIIENNYNDYLRFFNKNTN